MTDTTAGAQFFGTLQTEHIEGKWNRLLSGLAFYSADQDVTIYTPPGFVTDFASVPRIPGAYLLAGNTGQWEATGHDMGYRWNQLTRKAHDRIFLEAGRVRSAMREKQDWYLRAGRGIRSSGMYFFVRACGWGAYDPIPGCLDYRCKNACGRNCITCDLYYPLWQTCVVPGCVPDIAWVHEEYGWRP